QFSQSGITVFDNASSGGDVPDWKINQSVLDGMQAALSPKYAIVLRTADPDKLGWGLAMSPLDVMEGSGKAWSALSEQLGNNIEDVDLWIAVTATCAEAGNYSGPVPCGAAINRRSGLFGKQAEWLWFFAKVTIFDGHTRKYLAAMDVFRGGGDCGPYGNAVNMFEAQAGCIPGTDLGLDFAVDRWTDYSAAQRETIRAKLKDLIGPSLAYTLQKMNL
ncbi:MAG TPA: hypothetical protein VH722_16440, partial [Alphaproteobacteria bacterium]|nr:hypothetical protein [Alphaproteobacteria bacterium]